MKAKAEELKTMNSGLKSAGKEILRVGLGTKLSVKSCEVAVSNKGPFGQDNVARTKVVIQLDGAFRLRSNLKCHLCKSEKVEISDANAAMFLAQNAIVGRDNWATTEEAFLNQDTAKGTWVASGWKTLNHKVTCAECVKAINGTLEKLRVAAEKA